MSSFGISCSICELWQNPRPWQWSHPVFPASIAAKVSTTVPSLRRLRCGILLADRRLQICMLDMLYTILYKLLINTSTQAHGHLRSILLVDVNTGHWLGQVAAAFWTWRAKGLQRWPHVLQQSRSEAILLLTCLHLACYPSMLWQMSNHSQILGLPRDLDMICFASK